MIGKIRYSVRIEPGLHEAAQKVMRKEKMNPSELVRKALSEYIYGPVVKE